MVTFAVVVAMALGQAESRSFTEAFRPPPVAAISPPPRQSPPRVESPEDVALRLWRRDDGSWLDPVPESLLKPGNRRLGVTLYRWTILDSQGNPRSYLHPDRDFGGAWVARRMKVFARMRATQATQASLTPQSPPVLQWWSPSQFAAPSRPSRSVAVQPCRT